MVRFILAILLMVPIGASGQEQPWAAMSGDEIAATLTERTLKYSSATQKFYASGKTLYDAGRPSWGYWRAEMDQYCSQWPPSDLWTCYDMEKSDDAVRFVGAQGDKTEGIFVD